MTIKEAACVCGTSDAAIRSELMRGWIHGATFDGTEWTIPAQAVIEWADARWRAGRCYVNDPAWIRDCISKFNYQ
jgi:hypothetical protein